MRTKRLRPKIQENKKILNATPNEFGGIQFKSLLEKSIYKSLIAMGITPAYEGETFTFWKGLKPTVPFYCRYKQRATKTQRGGWVLKRNTVALQDMSYTPDFVFMYNGIKVLIEAKGFESETFPIRKKLFRAYLETLNYPVVYAEIFTVKELLAFMDILEKTQEEIKQCYNQ